MSAPRSCCSPFLLAMAMPIEAPTSASSSGMALGHAAQLRADVAHDLEQAAVGLDRLRAEELQHGDDLVLDEHREGGTGAQVVLAGDGLAREVVVLGDVAQPHRAALHEHAAGE